MASIRHTVTVAAPVDAVYAALTTPDGIAAWWTRDGDVAVRVGDVSTFRFRSGAFTRMRIAELVPDRLVAWDCIDGAAEWVGTRVEFLLTACEVGTRVEFRHGAWKATTAYMAACSGHWHRYLESLRSACEGRPGRPDPGTGESRRSAEP